MEAVASALEILILQPSINFASPVEYLFAADLREDWSSALTAPSGECLDGNPYLARQFGRGKKFSAVVG